MVTAQDVALAKERIGKYLYETPVIRLQNLDAFLGCQVYVKAENMQKTHSFKLRGALNKVLTLTPEQLKMGVVAVSSGNHGIGVAYAAKMLGIKATVVLTDTAPEIKVNEIKGLGAEVLLCELNARQALAQSLVEKYGSVFIPPYDDEAIIAGQGTCGVEIVQQLPEVDIIMTPVSGGGLVSGVAIGAKGEKSTVRVVGAEPAVVSRYSHSIAAGERVNLPKAASLADALLVTQPGQTNFPLVQKYVDQVVSTNEEYIAKAARLLSSEGKIVAEPASSITMGAILEGNIHFEPEQKVCFLLSGGNTELPFLASL
ncbi:MAG: threonine/serine dehydratase [Clostridium sp.]|uniref:threonine ammonia-lyase n=1 Tax=Clostridium sp. TaxID=1506 RepID=UPI0029113B32|nr:threonine/serine dehydratase [Clostridium sp.]MDU7338166.1 threonine/serine dehydratase [Clostridium sp.]